MKAPFDLLQTMVKPLVKLPGGKTRMLKHLLPIINSIPHKVYVEPYTEGEVRAYSVWKAEDVARLREALSRLKGRWIVKLNDCESNRAMFHGCKIKSVSTAATMSNKGQAPRRFGEIIITA